MAKQKHNNQETEWRSRFSEFVAIKDLHGYDRNSRTHSDAQIDQIAASMAEYGFTQPLVINDEMMILAGHGRIAAAERLGMVDVPVIRLRNMTRAQQRAYVIKDNSLAAAAGWDMEVLGAELGDLSAAGMDLNTFGFTDDFLTDLPGLDYGEKKDDAPPAGGDGDNDEPPPIDGNVAPVVRLGETWLLGNHRLFCGDVTTAGAIAALMQKETAHLGYSDPPYGIDVDFETNYKSKGNGVSAKGKYKKIANDKDTAVAKSGFALMQKHCETIVYWGANYYDFLPGAKCWLAWDKRGDLPDDDFAGLELAYTNAKKHSKLLMVRWKGMIKDGETSERRIHPTQKPVLLATKTFEYLQAGKIVLDLFGGSGSTLIACEKTGRSCRMAEIEPAYCDAIIKRWQDLTKLAARRADDGKSYKEMADAAQ